MEDIYEDLKDYLKNTCLLEFKEYSYGLIFENLLIEKRDAYYTIASTNWRNGKPIWKFNFNDTIKNIIQVSKLTREILYENIFNEEELSALYVIGVETINIDNV